MLGQATTAAPYYFFRTSFVLNEGVSDQYVQVSGDVACDDAFVLWINGTKVTGFLDNRLTGGTTQVYAGSSSDTYLDMPQLTLHATEHPEPRPGYS